jgi:hypothetical protein
MALKPKTCLGYRLPLEIIRPHGLALETVLRVLRRGIGA